jgi:hypothetical protein
MRKANAILLSLTLFGTACDLHEPSATTIAASFEQHRSGFDDLRQMVESDSKMLGLREVSSRSARASSCGDAASGTKCLAAIRWNVYVDMMRALGVQTINRELAPDRVYFVMYQRSYLMNARLRGVVFVTPSTTATQDLAGREEWNSIGDHWYSYLITDS